MPRIGAVRPVEPVAVPVTAPAPPAVPERPHAAEDHISFRNADGTLSRVCICVCDRCWPPGVKHPGQCPDWNDGDV